MRKWNNKRIFERGFKICHKFLSILFFIDLAIIHITDILFSLSCSLPRSNFDVITAKKRILIRFWKYVQFRDKVLITFREAQTTALRYMQLVALAIPSLSFFRTPDRTFSPITPENRERASMISQVIVLPSFTGNSMRLSESFAVKSRWRNHKMYWARNKFLANFS